MLPSTRLASSGMVVAERYRLVEPLGSGGMGAVWRAEHLSLRSPVAVKMLNPAIADDPEMLERFLREAQSAAALRGNYVVQVFDYGVHDGMPFIAMELLTGISLGTRLAATHQLDYADLARTFAHVSRAVSKAHELGIVHRDLKPDNIFLVRDGDEEVAKVLDFGIAKVLPSSIPLEEQNGQTTRTGTVLGTPFYMSPEQARGNRTVDFRADLWSMGVIAFECLTGRLPFTSSALGDLVVKICTHATPLPSRYAEVPAGFDEWFLRACMKAPEERFQSMREQNEALQTILGHNQAPLSPNRSTPRARRIITPDVAPPSSDLRDNFGDFQTLESITPPANDPSKPASGEPFVTLAELGPVGPRVTSAAPVEVTTPVSPPVKRRWRAALVVGTIAIGGLFLLQREKARRAVTVNAEISSPSLAEVANAPAPIPDAPTRTATNAATNVASAETPTAPPNTAASNEVASPSLPQQQESAPMDTPSPPVKLPGKASGAQPSRKLRGTPPAEPSTSSTGIQPSAGAVAPNEPEQSPPAQEPPAGETSRGKGLFDDRK